MWNNELREKLIESEMKRTKEIRRVAELEKDNEKLREYNRDMYKNNKVLRLTNKTLMSRLEELKTALSEAKKKANARIVVHASEVELRLREENKKLANGCQDAINVIEEQDSKIAVMERQIERLKKEKFEARDKAETWKQRAAFNASINSRLHDDLRDMREENQYLRAKKVKKFLGF